MVRLTLQLGDRTIHAPVRAVPWGSDATFVIEAAGQRHVVKLQPTHQQGTASVKMSYERDGSTVVSSTRQEVALRAATPVFADDAVRVIVTLIPTRVSVGTE